MPSYDYGCTACGRVFDVMHGVHGSGPERCEVCGGALRKLISAPAVHFKGSGWAGKDARDSGRARATASVPRDAKSGIEERKTGGDGSKSSSEGTTSSSEGGGEAPAPAASTPAASTPAPGPSGTT
jgi:putative FmdB family regulatory protein